MSIYQQRMLKIKDKKDCKWDIVSLGEVMLRLDPEVFWRVHRNAIVRVSAIRQVKPDEDGRLQVWLAGVPEPLRVSDAFRHRFRAM